MEKSNEKQTVQKIKGQSSASIFSKLFQSWTSDYVRLYFSNNKIIEANIAEESEIQDQQTYLKWKAVWQQMRLKEQPEALQKSLKESQKDQLKFGYFLSFLSNQTKFVIPLFMYYISVNIIAGQFRSTNNIILSLVVILLRIVYQMTTLHSETVLKNTGNAMYRFVSKAIVDKTLTHSLLCNKDFSSLDVSKLMHMDCQKLQLYPYRISLAMFNIYAIFFIAATIIFLTGWSGVIGIAILMLTVSTRICLKKKWDEFEAELAVKCDERVKKTMQVFSIIKFIKVSALQGFYFRELQKWRLYEVEQLLKKFCFEMVPLFSVMVSIRVVILSICLSLIFIGKNFDAATILSLCLAFNFMYIQMALIAMALIKNTQLSMKEIEKYLGSEQIDRRYIKRGKAIDSEIAISIKNGNFYWDSAKNELIANGQCHLKNINLSIHKGQLVALIGQFGSGKTSLISALLGEMERQGASQVELNGKIAYAAQKPWIMNATVRDNVLFGQPFQSARYSQALHFSCLNPDLQILTQGDQTMIGQRGCTLSGGQKARISLARALYSGADVYILDDILSAVDAHVGSFIFSQTLRGYLKGKTVLLITHSLFYVQFTDNIFIMEKGQIVGQGKFEQLKNHPILTSIKSASVNSFSYEDVRKHEDNSKNSIKQIQYSVDTVGQWEHLKSYLKRNGGSLFSIFSISYTIFIAIFSSLAAIWLNYWSQADDPTQIYYALIYFLSAMLIGLISLGMAKAMHVSTIFVTLHDDMVRSLLYAPLSYFQRVPFAKIISRLSSDMNTNDRVISTEYFSCVSGIGSCLSFFLCIYFVAYCYQSWLMAAFLTVYLFITFYLYYKYFVTSRELHHLQEDAKIPVNSSFSETIQGISTIRAYSAEKQERAVCFKCINSMSRISWATNALDGWVKFILCVTSNFSIVFAFLYMYYNGSNLKYDILLLFNILGNEDFLQKINMNVTELLIRLKSYGRCEELTKIQPEQGYKHIIQNHEAEAERVHPWAIKQGSIRFIDFSSRYSPQLEDVLKKVNFTVKAGEKIGIVGRTGSGKSSLILCLLRVLEASNGSIEIDKKDIAQLSLTDLRSNMSVILQEHFLFAGTVRENVDPTRQHSDADIQQALQQCGLWETLLQREGLQTKVSEAGDNLSAGEKQLLNIARTLLSPKRIVLVDEATANIDIKSDETVQRVLQKAFSGRTVLTIAHRIATVMHSDRILVLEKGKIAQLDSPQALLANPNSLFTKLYEQSGKTTSKSM